MREVEQLRNQNPTTPTWNGRRTFLSYLKCVCLICQSVLLFQTGNVERHFQAVHKKYATDFTLKRGLRKRKVREFKSQLIGKQEFFTKLNSKAKAVTKASLQLCHSFIKLDWSFWNEEMTKEAFVEAADLKHEEMWLTLGFREFYY